MAKNETTQMPAFAGMTIELGRSNLNTRQPWLGFAEGVLI